MDALPVLRQGAGAAMTDTTEAVERLRSATMPEYPIMPEVFIADVDAVCDALDQHQADRREQWAKALWWVAARISDRSEQAKPYPRGALRKMSKEVFETAAAIRSGKQEIPE